MWDESSVLGERHGPVPERIREIAVERRDGDAFSDYFATVAEFVLLVEREARFPAEGGLNTASLEELRARNEALYEDVLPARYGRSYANPAYAVERLGEEFGAMLSFLYREMRSLIPFVYEGQEEAVVIRLELFVEVYGAFACARQDSSGLPKAEEIRQILYRFVSDYTETAVERHLREMLVPEGNFAVDLIRNADLADVRYLFAYGEYIGENELEMARFMAALPEERIRVMADTFTEGYRKGFEVAGKDLSKKRTAEIRYRVGFERMMRRVVENLEKMGLQPVCYRAATSILDNPSLFKSGYYGGEPNRQYDFDHKDDRAIFFDRAYMNHRLEVTRTAFEKYKRQALEYAGPAVLETFGEPNFEPENKPEALRMSGEQNALWVEYRTLAGELQRKYILEEERSFTIIAFPMPEIRECFDEALPGKLRLRDRMECYHAFFEEIIRLNTLDYRLYRDIQQCLIDVLDTADHCEVKGMGNNRTDLRVNLRKLADPSRETCFENCVADVNIPVGEVFTSPVLAGTEGLLHVSRVYLNGLEYRNLELEFAEGRVRDYRCDNFAAEEENRKFIWENVLFRHDTLPMGEFAIGTNTTAYVVAQKYGVQDKFPILIAEKTGPHFAVGDTCYSHAENVRVYNPDGKEIVAKDNELSALRDRAPEKAYFNCHTDITIPYDELGELTAVRPDGSRVEIIREGRFVLPGTEELNRAFEE
ncbi:MAG: aminopeptidase [Clostridium sp.]|nr:aminopeptidase [Acetatifactor muris]MCM1526153.1 aminopeptidase [Bacteroides sp.]MCM1562699.1 aminopeptidase [Clostridium sp.]